MSDESVIGGESENHAPLMAKATLAGIDPNLVATLLEVFGKQLIEILISAFLARKQQPKEGLLDDSLSGVKAMLLGILLSKKDDVQAAIDQKTHDLVAYLLSKVEAYLKS